MLDLEKLKKIGLNPDKGLHFFGYDEEMYEKYLCDFERETYIDNAIIKLKEDDIKSAFSEVHKLKALVEYICIPSIDVIVHEITETLRAGKTDGVMDGLVFINTVVKDIKSKLKE